jgi:hypothetical protein
MQFYPAITEGEKEEIKKNNPQINVDNIVYNNDITKITSIFLPINEAGYLNQYLKKYNNSGEEGLKTFFQQLQFVNKKLVEVDNQNPVKNKLHFYHKSKQDTKNIYVGLLEKTKTPYIQIKSVQGKYVLFPISNPDLLQLVLEQAIIDKLNYNKEQNLINNIQKSIINKIKMNKLKNKELSNNSTKDKTSKQLTDKFYNTIEPDLM